MASYPVACDNGVNYHVEVSAFPMFVRPPAVRRLLPLVVPSLFALLFLLLCGCETTPAPVVPDSTRLMRIESMASGEEERLRTAYQRVQAKLYSLERVKETEQNAYLTGDRDPPRTVVLPPAGFASAEVWRAHLESERDQLAAAIVEIEDIQKRLYKQRRQAEADEAPLIPQLRIP